MLTDPIADMLSRIRNANRAMHDSAAMPTSRMKEEIARLLHEEGYIKGFSVVEAEPVNSLVIELVNPLDVAIDGAAITVHYEGCFPKPMPHGERRELGRLAPGAKAHAAVPATCAPPREHCTNTSVQKQVGELWTGFASTRRFRRP